MQVGVLGPLTVRVDDCVVAVPGRKPRAILSLLALRAGRTVATEELIDALWGESPPPTARKAVQTHVWTFRRALPHAIETVSGGYRWPLDAGDVDAVRFERMIANAELAEPAAAAQLLTAALQLWRGRPLPDLADHDVGPAEAVRLVELRLRAEDELGERRLALGGDGDLIADLERAVRDEPLRERRWAVLITALYRAGRQADALRAAQRLRRRLSEQLGLDPSPALQRLEDAVLAHSPALLAEPRRAPVVRRRAGPAPARLVGRGGVVAELAAVLADRRVVTLTGPGGVGKSSVALAVVESTATTFPDGVAWADLSVLEPGGDVARVVADAFGVSGEPGAPALDALPRAVEGRRLLLVADNCEHVLDGVVTVVEALPDTVVLCTSREPLGIAAEHVVVLAPLGFADAGSPAVELLRARLGSHAGSDAESAALVDLAGQLDGLPLALELAAARCRSLGVADVSRRLAGRLDLLAERRRPSRHRSLDATLSWSYDLLGPDERVVLQRLSVFAGSFGLDAAERVAGCGRATPASVDDVLASLVDKSLVLRSGDRFRLLDTTRSFAATLLGDAGAEAARRAHVAWVVDRVADIRDGLCGRDEKAWVARLDAEWPDVRAAFDRALELDDADAVTSLAVDLVREAMWRRPEAFPWIEQAVRRYGDRPGLRRRELLGAGCYTAFSGGDVAEAVRRADLALALDPDPCGNPATLPVNGAAGAYFFAGDHAAVAAVCRRALGSPALAQDPAAHASVLTSIALCRAPGTRVESKWAAVQALQIARASGNPSMIAYAMATYAATCSGEAAAAYDEAHAVASDVGNRFVANWAASRIALCHRSVGSGDASPAEAASSVARLVELSREGCRSGWLTHARGFGRGLAVLLFELGRPGVAAAVLGGCDGFDTVAVSANGTLPQALDELSHGGGSEELRHFYEYGRRAKYADLLNLAEESSSRS